MRIELHERLIEGAVCIGAVAADGVADVGGGQAVIVAVEPAVGVGELAEPLVTEPLDQAEFKTIVIADGFRVRRAAVAVGHCRIHAKPGIGSRPRPRCLAGALIYSAWGGGNVSAPQKIFSTIRLRLAAHQRKRCHFTGEADEPAYPRCQNPRNPPCPGVTCTETANRHRLSPSGTVWGFRSCSGRQRHSEEGGSTRGVRAALGCTSRRVIPLKRGRFSGPF